VADREVLGGIVLALLFVLLILMALGWQARRRRQSHLEAPPPVPAELGAIIATFDALYVATTVAGDPLNRIAVRGLGFRARASVTVAESGIVLSLQGERDVFIPVTGLRAVTRATWTIDRVVERGGLVMVAWTLGTDDVDSYLRLEQSQQLIDAVLSIIGTPTTEGGA